MGFDIKEDGTATCKGALDDGGGGDGDAGENVNNRVTSNSTTTTTTSKDKDERSSLGVGVCVENGETDGPDLGGGDKLVLDVLNDELVERVRDKMLSGSKDLFEACQSAVKSFLAGEPFQEFEHSMYFHRYVVVGL